MKAGDAALRCEDLLALLACALERIGEAAQRVVVLSRLAALRGRADRRGLGPAHLRDDARLVGLVLDPGVLVLRHEAVAGAADREVGVARGGGGAGLCLRGGRLRLEAEHHRDLPLGAALGEGDEQVAGVARERLGAAGRRLGDDVAELVAALRAVGEDVPVAEHRQRDGLLHPRRKCRTLRLAAARPGEDDLRSLYALLCERTPRRAGQSRGSRGGQREGREGAATPKGGMRDRKAVPLHRYSGVRTAGSALFTRRQDDGPQRNRKPLTAPINRKRPWAAPVDAA
ncbi:protein of unknown function [Methylorubrum extorquens]|uniref:Uncharacterized protein n=1 Tax=Methylorubrum extorquens TaxID=408 RepID=A0A2N9ANX5_METEX|nr:protein of unknown function [Methylorubrum extorquens]